MVLAEPYREEDGEIGFAIIENPENPKAYCATLFELKGEGMSETIGPPTVFNGHPLWPSLTPFSSGLQKGSKKKNRMSICNVCLSVVSRERDIP